MIAGGRFFSALRGDGEAAAHEIATFSSDALDVDILLRL